MTLTSFLLARIAEDEATTYEFKRVGEPYLPVGQVFYVTPHWDMTARWLAECEAKRRIVEWSGEIIDVDGGLDVLRMIALPYADHPDYREEWKP